jgi:uncharacterized membrane protein
MPWLTVVYTQIKGKHMSKSAAQAVSARKRLIVAVSAGLLIAILFSVVGAAKFAPLAAWDTTALVYGCWVWVSVLPMSAAEARTHAVRENPGRGWTDALLLVASIASLAAVGVLIVDASKSTGVSKVEDIAVGLVSIIISWALVHTTFMLNYARLYYGQPEGGISFNEKDPPRYADFAYLAFTIGMTFQVSDTDLQVKKIRATALKHAMLSYLFGTVIIATTINTLASLSK